MIGLVCEKKAKCMITRDFTGDEAMYKVALSRLGQNGVNCTQHRYICHRNMVE